MNAALAESPPPGRLPERPVLFATGSPRSGTTLLAQAVCQYLEVGYVDNLAARFWLAPSIGLRLSHMVFGPDRQSGFESAYGRTQGNSIHGFHYFWMRHFKLENVEDLFTPLASRNVDWNVINGHLAAMEEVAGRAMLFKGYYPSYFMAEVTRAVPNAVFILIEREPLDQALSIYEARQTLHGEVDSWWSMQPPNVHQFLGRPVEEQIAGQIEGLKRFFNQQIERAADDLTVVRVRYEKLCEEPHCVLADIASTVDRTTGFSIPISPSARWPVRTP